MSAIDFFDSDSHREEESFRLAFNKTDVRILYKILAELGLNSLSTLHLQFYQNCTTFLELIYFALYPNVCTLAVKCERICSCLHGKCISLWFDTFFLHFRYLGRVTSRNRSQPYCSCGEWCLLGLFRLLGQMWCLFARLPLTYTQVICLPVLKN